MPIIVGPPSPGTAGQQRLYDLIRAASYHVGDLEEGTLTSVTSTSVFADNVRHEPEGHFTGGSLSLIGATSPDNVGVERRIADHAENGVFTTNAFPVVPTVGDSYEIRKEPQHTRYALRTFVNEAVRNIQNASWVVLDSIDDLASSLTYDEEVHEYEVPAELINVHKVLWQAEIEDESDETWYPVPHSEWWTNGNGTLHLEPGAGVPDAATIKLLGSRRPATMAEETDYCEIEAEWPVLYAAKMMCLRLAKGSADGDEYMRKYSAYRDEAEAARLRTRKNIPANSKRVRPS